MACAVAVFPLEAPESAPPPELPAEIIEKTREKYMECMKRIVG